MTRIDAHQHFWSLERGDYDWLGPELAVLYRDFTPGDLEAQLAENEIAGTIAVQAAATVEETCYLLGLADSHAWIRGVVGWIDFDADDAPAQIDRLGAHPKLVGIRPMLQDMTEDEWILHRSRDAALRAMARRQLVFDALIRPRHLPYITSLADRHPDLTIVIDHAAKPAIGADAAFPAWHAGMEAAAKRPNVYCKLSGLVTEAPGDAACGLDVFRPYVDALLQCFTADRLIWGSDWPVLLMASDYAAWSQMTDMLLSRVDSRARANIRGGNALRVYDLMQEEETT